MSFFSKKTTRFDVATTAVAAFLALFKAADTYQTYKREQLAVQNKELIK